MYIYISRSLSRCVRSCSLQMSTLSSSFFCSLRLSYLPWFTKKSQIPRINYTSHIQGLKYNVRLSIRFFMILPQICEQARPRQSARGHHHQEELHREAQDEETPATVEVEGTQQGDGRGSNLLLITPPPSTLTHTRS